MKKLIFLAAAFIPLSCIAQKQETTFVFARCEPDTTGQIILSAIPGSVWLEKSNANQKFHIDHQNVHVSVLEDGTKIVIKFPGYTYTIEVDSIKSIEQQETRKVYPFKLSQQP